MNEQDPLSTYSLWAKQADIAEEKEPTDYMTKPDGTSQKENMDERGRSARREDSGDGVRHWQAPKPVTRRTRIVPSEDSDAIMYADEGTQTALGDTPPSSQYKGRDDEYASTTRKLARATPAEPSRAKEKLPMRPGLSQRNNYPSVLDASSQVTADPLNLKPTDNSLAKQSWSKRALARTKDILSITAKEPSTMAFEDYRSKEFKRAGVKAGDNAAAKLHVSSQKLPPEAPKVQSRELPPVVTRSMTDANTTANKSMGRLQSAKGKIPGGRGGGRGSSAQSLASGSSGSRGSSVVALGGGSARGSFQGSAGGGGGGGGGSGSGSGSGSGAASERGGVGGPGMPRLMHSQTDGSSRGGAAGSGSAGVGAGRSTTRLSEKQKAAAVDERW